MYRNILQEILRSLGKTILVKILVKKTVSQLSSNTRNASQKITDELNKQVRKWGIDVRKVELSPAKILKHPDPGSISAVGSILKGLGVKRDKEYLTPQDVVRDSHRVSDKKCSSKSTTRQSKDNGITNDNVTSHEEENGKLLYCIF
jgi:uncharacterized membrane protein YqiK